MNRKLAYDVNWTTAISKVRGAGVFLFLGQGLVQLVQQLQDAVAECLSPVRPGRSSPRDMKRKRKRFPPNRKRI